MITEWLFGIWEAIAVWFLGLLPSWPATEFVFGLSAILAPVSGGLQGLGGWIPWELINVLLPVSVSLFVASLILRTVKSLIPTISG